MATSAPFKYSTNIAQEIEIAARQHDLDAIKNAFSQARFPIQARFALYEAIKNGDLEIVKYFVDRGVNIRTDREPLKLAVEGNQLEIADYLLNHGAFPGVIDPSDVSIAAGEGNLEMLELLLNNRAPIDEKATFYAINQSRISASTEDIIDTIQFLLDRDFPLTPEAFHEAVNIGDIKLIKFLLKNGANPNEITYESPEYPIIGAFKRKRYDIVNLLLKAGFDPKLIPLKFYQSPAFIFLAQKYRINIPFSFRESLQNYRTNLNMYFPLEISNSILTYW